MVKRRNIWLFVGTLAGFFISCSTYDLGGMLVAGSTPEERFEYSISLSGLNSHAQRVINDQESYRFVVASDLHIREDDWDKAGRFFRSTAKDDLLTILLGNYMYVAGSPLERFSDSIKIHKYLHAFTAIGNHDVYKNGYQDTYRTTFGATSYSFEVATADLHDLFIVLDSANGTLGIDQFEWLQSLLSGQRSSVRHCFVFTHANFFNPVGYMDVISTYPVQEQMKLLDVFARHDVTAVFTGHSHLREETNLRGVKYITVGSWSQGKREGEYCRVECNTDGSLTIEYAPVD